VFGGKGEVPKVTDFIRKYEAKTGETVTATDDFAVKVLDSGEFMKWKLAVRDGTPFFWVDQTYGQMQHFALFIQEVCNAAGIEWIAAATTRNPAPFIRKWKCVRLPEYDYEFEGRRYSVVKGHLSDFVKREVRNVSI